jgi:hypothetical protein
MVTRVGFTLEEPQHSPLFHEPLFGFTPETKMNYHSNNPFLGDIPVTENPEPPASPMTAEQMDIVNGAIEALSPRGGRIDGDVSAEHQQKAPQGGLGKGARNLQAVFDRQAGVGLGLEEEERTCTDAEHPPGPDGWDFSDAKVAELALEMMNKRDAGETAYRAKLAISLETIREQNKTLRKSVDGIGTRQEDYYDTQKSFVREMEKFREKVDKRLLEAHTCNMSEFEKFRNQTRILLASSAAETGAQATLLQVRMENMQLEWQDTRAEYVSKADLEGILEKLQEFGIQAGPTLEEQNLKQKCADERRSEGIAANEIRREEADREIDAALDKALNVATKDSRAGIPEDGEGTSDTKRYQELILVEPFGVKDTQFFSHWITQFETECEHLGITQDCEKLTRMSAALRGKAVEAYMNLNPRARQYYRTAVMALEEEFGDSGRSDSAQLAFRYIRITSDGAGVFMNRLIEGARDAWPDVRDPKTNKIICSLTCLRRNRVVEKFIEGLPVAIHEYHRSDFYTLELPELGRRVEDSMRPMLEGASKSQAFGVSRNAGNPNSDPKFPDRRGSSRRDYQNPTEQSARDRMIQRGLGCLICGDRSHWKRECPSNGVKKQKAFPPSTLTVDIGKENITPPPSKREKKTPESYPPPTTSTVRQERYKGQTAYQQAQKQAQEAMRSPAESPIPHASRGGDEEEEGKQRGQNSDSKN